MEFLHNQPSRRSRMSLNSVLLLGTVTLVLIQAWAQGLSKPQDAGNNYLPDFLQ